MAATVTVLCPNGRRCNVKVTSNTVLLQILEQACVKQKFDPDLHILKHHSKVLDLTTTFRYANLPNNAKLEMVAADKPRVQATQVVVALQHEDGSRVQGTFPPISSLWDVVIQLQGSPPDNGQTEPVLVYMNQQVCGESALKRQTLRDLGLSSGRGVVRLLFRPLRQTSNEACKPIESSSSKTSSPADSQPVSTDLQTTSNQMPTLECAVATANGTNLSEDVLKEETKRTLLEGATSSQHSSLPEKERLLPKKKPSQAASAGATSVVEEPMETSDMPYFPSHPFSIFPPDTTAAVTMEATPYQLAPIEEEVAFPFFFQQPFKFPGVTVQLVNDEQPKPKPQPPPRIYDEPCDRETVVYCLEDMLATPTEEVPDSFFNVTLQDVKNMQDDLKRQVQLAADAPLLTQAQKLAEQERKWGQYDRAVIRVHFPDKWVLQGCFRPRESLKALVQFIRENLADPQLKFHLYTTPPKQVLRSGKVTIAEAGFVPAAIVHLGTESEERPLLSAQCLQSAQSALQAEVAHVRGRGRLGSAELYPLSGSGTATEVTTSQNKRVNPGLTQEGDTGQTLGARPALQSQPHGTDPTRKVPKWFKMGK